MRLTTNIFLVGDFKVYNQKYENVSSKINILSVMISVFLHKYAQRNGKPMPIFSSIAISVEL